MTALPMTEMRETRSGFTLIEIIVSLVLLGLLGVFFSFGLTTAMKGYVFTRENAETTQKGQIAMLRLTKELSVISAVSSGTDTSISYTSIKSGSGVNQSVTWSGTANDPLYLGSDILVDNVNGFEFGYYPSFSGAKGSSWTASTKIIEITLELEGADDIVSTFSTRVFPRNV